MLGVDRLTDPLAQPLAYASMLELLRLGERLLFGLGLLEGVGRLEGLELLAPLALPQAILRPLGPSLLGAIQLVVGHLVQPVGTLDAAQIRHPALVILPVVDRPRPDRPPVVVFLEVHPRGDDVDVLVVGVLMAHD